MLLRISTRICGQRFTIADAYLFTVLRWAYAVKLNLEGLEHIAAFMQRMAERPQVQDALSAEGLKVIAIGPQVVVGRNEIFQSFVALKERSGLAIRS